MRLKISIVFLVLAIVTGACGVSSPVLSSGPNLPYNAETSSNQTNPDLPAVENPEPAVIDPVESQAPQVGDLTGDFLFALKPDSPRYLPAFTQPDAGCAWVGVAGQVFDPQGAPVNGVVVVVKGSFNGVMIDAQTQSGLQETYGPSGFEVKIGDLSADSQNALTIQLVNSKNEALSDVYPLTTYNDCQRNLILTNFQAQSAAWQTRLP